MWFLWSEYRFCILGRLENCPTVIIQGPSRFPQNSLIEEYCRSFSHLAAVGDLRAVQQPCLSSLLEICFTCLGIGCFFSLICQVMWIQPSNILRQVLCHSPKYFNSLRLQNFVNLSFRPSSLLNTQIYDLFCSSAFKLIFVFES